MYSALKHEGKALYEYARAGIEIERKSRLVTIRQIDVNAFDGEVATIIVSCTKGTYIRTLAEDIGELLACGAHLIGLRRTATANYLISQTVTLAQFESMTEAERLAALAPPDSAVLDLPEITLDNDSVFYLLQGQPVWLSGHASNGLLRIYDEAHRFLGLGEQQADGKIAPKRLMQQVNN
jgi:tRNA pseudouridine55 synthase